MKKSLLGGIALILSLCLLFSSCVLFETAKEPLSEEPENRTAVEEQTTKPPEPSDRTPAQKFGEDPKEKTPSDEPKQSDDPETTEAPETPEEPEMPETPEEPEEPAGHTHVWNSGLLTKEATDEEDGERVFTCSVCGATDKLSIPKRVNLVAAFQKSAAKPLENEEQTRREKILTDYGWRLYSEILTDEDPGENQLFSPLSLEFAFCMVANGANGKTREEIEKAMGLTVAEMNEALCGILTRVEEAKDGKAILADSIWMKDDGSFAVKPEFLQAVADYYEAQVYEEPLDGDTLEKLNGWVKEYTRGMIPHLLDSIDPSTVMLLVNVLTFEDQWKIPYEDYQVKENQIFHDYDGTDASVTFLSSSESDFVEGNGFTGFIKSYQGTYKILFLLPDEKLDVYEAMGNLTGEDYLALCEKADAKIDVRAKVPAFSYDCSYDLIASLEGTGMELPFSPSEADFSLLGESVYGNIYIGLVLQKTHIELDRNGTKAAAATVIGMKANSMAPGNKEVREVILDRPFGYVIFDSVTGTPLFIGITATLGD